MPVPADPGSPLWQLRNIWSRQQGGYDPEQGPRMPNDIVHYRGEYYSPNSEAGRAFREIQGLQWDPYTFMPTNLGHAPTRMQAAELDYYSQRLYQEQKNRYFQDALGSSSQALRMLGEYRPGGAAGVAAGILQNRSALQFNIANSMERPDFYALKRGDDAFQARKAAKEAGMMSMVGNLAGQGAAIAMGAAGGGGPGGALAATGGPGYGPGAGGGGVMGGPAMGTTLGSMGGTTFPSMGGGAGQPPAAVPGPGGAPGGGGAMESRAGGGGPGGAPGGAGAGGMGGPQQVAPVAPIQSAMLILRARTLDHDFMMRANANVDYYLSRSPGVRRPPALYDRVA